MKTLPKTEQELKDLMADAFVAFAHAVNEAVDFDQLTEESLMKLILAHARDVREGWPESSEQEHTGKGDLAIMGNIDVIEPDGEQYNYPMALLITFSDRDEIKTAIANRRAVFPEKAEG